MPDIPPPGPLAVPPTRRRKPWQVGLRGLVLLIAAAAVWMTDVANRRENARLQAQIETLLPMARELIVSDPSRIAVVRRDEHWYDENEWDIHLPPGRYRLCLALEEIDGKTFPPKFKSAPLPAGRHRLALTQTFENNRRGASISCDGSTLLSADVEDTTDHSGSEGGGNFDRSEQRDPGEPLILFQRRYMRRTTPSTSMAPTGPTDGLIIWIEPANPRPAGTK